MPNYNEEIVVLQNEVALHFLMRIAIEKKNQFNLKNYHFSFLDLKQKFHFVVKKNKYFFFKGFLIEFFNIYEKYLQHQQFFS